MSVQTLYTAATGMTALETKLDVVANNLANVSTTGFKRSRANFEDLFYRNSNCPGRPTRNRTSLRPAFTSVSVPACKARKPTSAKVL